MNVPDPLLGHIRALAGDLPAATARAAARTLSEARPGDWTELRQRIAAVVPSPHYRQLAAELISEWQRTAPEVEPASIGLAILVATPSLVRDSETPRLALTWTGPD